MKKSGTKGFTLVVATVVLLGLVAFTYINNNSANEKKTQKTTEEEQLLNYDFEENYPKTVRETVKLHCRYLRAAYNGIFTEDELYTVNQKMRELFDEELLNYNVEADQLAGLKEEVQEYKDSNKKFSNYSVAESSQIKYNTEDGVEYAKIKVSIGLIIDSMSVTGEQEYILRKEADGRWKILGWQAVATPSEGESE